MTRVGFVCTGNICRSPMAEVVLAELAAAAGRADLEVSSAGTANWHHGEPIDPRAAAALVRAGFVGPPPIAQWATSEWIDRQDVIVAMTHAQRSDVRDRVGDSSRPVALLRALPTDGVELDLADPYYGHDGDFDDCLAEIIRSCRALLRALAPDGPPAAGSTAGRPPAT